MDSTSLGKITRPALFLGMLALAITLIAVNFDNRRYKRNVERYQVPEVTLINHNNQPVPLIEYLQTDKPLVMEFIYTGCTTVCPAMMVKFSNLQQRLKPHTDQMLMVSISIDPENDTPEVLRNYRNQYHAQPGWDFLTGSVEDIRKVMDAFDTRPTDMATLDAPVLLRAPGSNRWIRLSGEIDGHSFWNEYQSLSNTDKI